jgi:two-component sensor histidine kinase
MRTEVTITHPQPHLGVSPNMADEPRLSSLDIVSADDVRRRLVRARDAAERSDEPQIVEDLGLAIELQGRLVAEFQHRVRNILAMLRSVVGRTAANKTDVQDYVDHLQGRIDAIARTQSSFARSPGRCIEVEDIIRDEMVSQAANEDKYRLTGPATPLEPKAGEVLTLAIHELATNSVKFGALGDEGGMIEIDWSIEPRETGDWLQLNWRETGLDLSNLHPLGGFGTELITKRIPYELGGSGTLDFQRHGLVATIEVPITDASKILQIAVGPMTEAGQ